MRRRFSLRYCSRTVTRLTSSKRRYSLAQTQYPIARLDHQSRRLMSLTQARYPIAQTRSPIAQAQYPIALNHQSRRLNTQSRRLNHQSRRLGTQSRRLDPFCHLDTLSSATALHTRSCALMALVIDDSHYPTGRLFSDCQGNALPQLVAMASSRSMWRAKVASLS